MTNDKDDDKKDDNDVHQLITDKKKKNEKLVYVSIAAVLGSRKRFKNLPNKLFCRHRLWD